MPNSEQVYPMALTLAWTHSIEKIRWEEDYRATPAGVVLLEDRIQGTGAVAL